MRIKVLAVSPAQEVNKGKNTYSTMDVSFKNVDTGKIAGKTLISFKYPDLWNFFKTIVPETTVDVVVEKQGEFWNWVTAAIAPEVEGNPLTGALAGGQGFTTPAWTKPVSNYETREERSWRQVMIVRQSSVGYAVNLLKTEKNIPSLEEVLDVAKRIEQYVYSPVEEINGENSV